MAVPWGQCAPQIQSNIQNGTIQQVGKAEQGENTGLAREPTFSVTVSQFEVFKQHLFLGFTLASKTMDMGI